MTPIRLAMIGATVAVVLGATACNSSKPSPESSTTTVASSTIVAVTTTTAAATSSTRAPTTTALATTTTAAPTTTKAPTVVNVKIQPGTAKGFVGALKDVSGFKCEYQSAKWVASGKVTNSSRFWASYRIYVSLLDASNDTRAVFEIDTVTMRPNLPVAFSGSISLDEQGLTCVLRVERTDIS